MAEREESDLEVDEDAEDEGDPNADVATEAGPNADDRSDIEKYIRADVLDNYEVHSYRHAASILSNSCASELQDIQEGLLNFKLTTKDIGAPGKNESAIPRKFSATLRPKGWIETRIQGDLLVRLLEYDELLLPNGKSKKNKRTETQARLIRNYIDGHKIDYVKGRVAFDLEWNSKDQTFDRDLYALRAFHECGLISVGVMVTRSASLNPLFEEIPRLDKSGVVVRYKEGKYKGQPIPVKEKYGASTTWMGKLLYRLNAGRHGGCPILVFGITPKLLVDWPLP